MCANWCCTSSSHSHSIFFHQTRYLVPTLIALTSFIVRWFTDMTCGAWVCRATSEVLSHVYVVVICFLVIVAATKAKQIKDTLKRIRKAVEVMTNEKNKSD